MSFQAYLDNIEKKTGQTPAEIIASAKATGFDTEAKASETATWLKEEYGLGHGHAMALVHVIKNGTKLESKHVGSSGTHRDESDELRLDGITNR